MKSAPFWKFATRLLRRKKLAVGTIVFSVISAGGLAAGLVSIGPLLKLILAGSGNDNLQTIVRDAVTKTSWLASIVPSTLLDALPTDRFAGVALILCED